jgi:hypothetical protein
VTTASPASQTVQFAGQAAGVLADAPHQVAAAASRADLRAALALAERAEHAITGLRRAIVADMLADGAGWWQVGEALVTHPQAAFEAYAHLAPGQQAPAAQRPDLAIVLTAGLAAAHDPQPEYGIDIDDLGPGHSVNSDPAVVRVREAARLLGAGTWITVTSPAGSRAPRATQSPGTDAISQWTSVVADPAELTWLREVLALNAAGDDQGDDLD